MRQWPLIFMAGLMLGLAGEGLAAEVGLIRVDSAIGPATANYISRATQLAAARGNVCLIIELDTLGGLLETTKQITQIFYSSPVPVVVYVSPSGASATSAGCFITLAADVAAMAPNTSIGAAHPVRVGPGGTQPENKDDAISQKHENFAIGLIEAIATKRQRNVEWAKASVRDSAAITAEKALEMNVIEIIAVDVPDLLKQLDGREVNGKKLGTAGARVVSIPMIGREKLFLMLARPEVMLILMLAAIYGIMGELSNPGAILPGVVGGIALILALYMSSILPINVAGLALIGLAVVLFIADIYAPTHGVLTFGGIVSFFLGALMLFNRDPAFRLSLSYIIPATLITAAFFIFIVAAGLKAQLLPVRVGKETMLGKIVPAVKPISGQTGKVFVEGEYWNAVSDEMIQEGQAVEIVSVEGLMLKVKPAKRT
jgi:membrane-bound serine protease (ClpP class)